MPPVAFLVPRLVPGNEGISDKKMPIQFNNEIQLIFSDVDETIADLYIQAESEMVNELEKLLIEGKTIFLISGQGLKSICFRITDQIKPALRNRIFIGHCSGSEVRGFDETGSLEPKPIYSVYDESMNEVQKGKWRAIIRQIVTEFNLEVFNTMPVQGFIKESKSNPLAIMLEDRGPQITFEVVNAYNLSARETNILNLNIPKTHGVYDLRTLIIKRSKELLENANISVTPRLAGVFAIDFTIKGISKTTAVKSFIRNKEALSQVGLNGDIISEPKCLEVWGDKFSTIRGGTDRFISEALPKKVRSISFRNENPNEFPMGYNIVVWDGQEHLHNGLLEFLRSR